MKILGINATQAKNRKSSSDFLLDYALGTIREKGHETEKIKLIDYSFEACNACSICMQLKPCPLNEKDDIPKLLEIISSADAYIFSYPVYGYVPPEILFKFLHRLSPKYSLTDKFSTYHLDVIPDVKGWAFKNKYAGVISVGAGIGNEAAYRNLSTLFKGLRLNIITSIGLTLLENDCSPHISSNSFHKDIEKAEYALSMVRGLSKTILNGGTYFDQNECYIDSQKLSKQLRKEES